MAGVVAFRAPVGLWFRYCGGWARAVPVGRLPSRGGVVCFTHLWERSR